MWSRRWTTALTVSAVIASGLAFAAGEGTPVHNVPPVAIKMPPPPALSRVPDCTNIGSFRGVDDNDCLKANAPSQVGEKGGTGETGPYAVEPNHFKPKFPEGYKWGRVGGIFAETPDRVYIYASGIVKNESTPAWGGVLRYFSMVDGGLMPADMRREFVMTVWNRQGEMIEVWKQVDKYHNAPGSIPHRVRVSPYDPEKHVWIIDEGKPPYDQIIKYTRDGKEVMRIAGADATADIAFLPNGDIYAVQRTTTGEPIIRYNKDGKEIGRLGPKGSTKDAHCIAFDKAGNIYIGEMGGGQVQVFDPTGKPKDIWPNIRITNYCGMTLDDKLWVFDSDSMKFLKYDLNGKLLTSWGTFGHYPGRFLNVNQFDVDSEGNLYVAEPTNWRPQFFRPKKNADPAQIITGLKR